MNKNTLFSGLIPSNELFDFINDVKYSIIEKGWLIICASPSNKEEYFVVSILVAERYASNVEALLEDLLVMTNKNLNWQRIRNMEIRDDTKR